MGAPTEWLCGLCRYQRRTFLEDGGKVLLGLDPGFQPVFYTAADSTRQRKRRQLPFKPNYFTACYHRGRTTISANVVQQKRGNPNRTLVVQPPLRFYSRPYFTRTDTEPTQRSIGRSSLCIWRTTLEHPQNQQVHRIQLHLSGHTPNLVRPNA